MMKETAIGKQSRSVATQKALMLAAEKLIAQKGIENVSIKEIVKASEQKNESALQYHFKNLKGLIGAIQNTRNKEIQLKRSELLQEILALTNNPEVRDICRLMVMPTFLLAKASPKFRRYVVGFSLQLALAADSTLTEVVWRGEGVDHRLGKLLRTALPDLEETIYRQRMESTIRLASISMCHHARQKNAFRGTTAEFFVSSLIDAMTGLLRAPVSEETTAMAKSLSKSRKRTKHDSRKSTLR
ncbi:MAG: hypothetical protein VB957_09705 [Pseudomonadales bacterium]